MRKSGESMYRIMIVEDDQTIASAMKKFLESWNYHVVCVENFKEVLGTFKKENPDIILLDLMLPYFNGFYWCEEIRKVSKVPIMFLSSANDNMNIVMAIAAGADDFIAKPIDLTVLVAKIQAMIRRTYDFAGKTDFLEYRGVRFYSESHTVSYKENILELTKNESRILKILMENKGKIVKRDNMMEALWQTDCYVDENTLSVNVNRLRKKLEQIGIVDFIQTKKGVGYSL